MIKNIALVAHDNRKKDLVEWVKHNRFKLIGHNIFATGTTGRLISEVLDGVVSLKSGPLGGDQQLGALIAEEKIDFMIFFWDPMTNQPHDVDVKALLRMTVLYNIPTACNRSTADFLITSILFSDQEYRPVKRDYESYLHREVQKNID
ncbi:MAG: methylglyoxal synthase [Bacteroidetes bacterium HGW-Bacteroidetes-1]|jgi:methylglyoxal synthase|nr:MAG: methylglyoxal synthase [Bacteroidetes bacterium HGW-Bacteroidetes-1]